MVCYSIYGRHDSKLDLDHLLSTDVFPAYGEPTQHAFLPHIAGLILQPRSKVLGTLVKLLKKLTTRAFNSYISSKGNVLMLLTQLCTHALLHRIKVDISPTFHVAVLF